MKIHPSIVLLFFTLIIANSSVYGATYMEALAKKCRYTKKFQKAMTKHLLTTMSESFKSGTERHYIKLTHLLFGTYNGQSLSCQQNPPQFESDKMLNTLSELMHHYLELDGGYLLHEAVAKNHPSFVQVLLRQKKPIIRDHLGRFPHEVPVEDPINFRRYFYGEEKHAFAVLVIKNHADNAAKKIQSTFREYKARKARKAIAR